MSTKFLPMNIEKYMLHLDADIGGYRIKLGLIPNHDTEMSHNSTCVVWMTSELVFRILGSRTSQFIYYMDVHNHMSA